MKNKFLSVLAAGLTVASPVAMAADGAVTVDGATVSGELGVGVRGLKSNSTDPSKLQQFRDLGSGLIGSFDIRGRSDEGYLNFFGENLNRDDQYIDMKGGKYGAYKFQLYDNEMRYRLGSGLGAMTPYSGAGSNTLTNSVWPNGNLNSWNSYDNSYTRKDMGGMFEFSNNSPWYVRVDANQVKKNGIKTMAASQGTSPSNGFVDLAAPVDYTTQNASLEAGYQSKRGQIAASAMYSKFSNANPYLRFSNGFFAPLAPTNYDVSVQPTDSDFMKLGLNGNLKQLPLSSTLAGRLTYSKLTNDISVLSNMLSAGNTNPASSPTSGVYSGNIKTTTASLSLSSQPIAKADTRLYWNWNHKANESNQITFQGAGLACGGLACETEAFNYRKNNAGLELGYRLNPANKVSVGADYLVSDRQRLDFVRSLDRKYFAELKTSPTEILDARFKYQYLQRRSNFLEGQNSDIAAFVRKFDLANNDQQSAKITFDLSPAQFLDFGVEAIYKHNNYKDTLLGRQGDTRQEYYASVSYGDPQKFRVMLFGDIELAQFDSLHRVCTTAAPSTGNCDPNLPPSGGTPSTAYNWTAKNSDRAYQIGLGSDWLPMPKLKINSSLLWSKTNGTTDFAAQPGTIATATANLLRPIQNFDNTTRASLNLRGTYAVSKTWDLTTGYAFERYRYSDIGYDGFSYTVAPINTSASYVSGQNALQNYTAQMVYLLGTFKF